MKRNRRPSLSAILRISLSSLLLGFAVTTAGAQEFEVADIPRGVIAFSSVAPRHFDLYQSSKGGDAETGTQVTRLTQAAALDYNAAFASDGNHIAFVSERDGNVDLYTMKSDGTAITRLTSNQAMDDHPAWSPDSRQLAFVSTRKAAPAGRAWNGIYIMDADGTDVHRISGDGAADYSPAWSPKGDLIAFVSGTSRPEDLYVMKPDGTGRRLLIENGGWPTFIQGGAAVCFHRRNGGQWDLWQINLDGTDPKRIMEKASMPRATADGSKLAFVNRDGDGGTPHISVLDLDSGKVTYITRPSGGNGDTAHWNPAISPDGRHVVYHKATPDQETPSAEWWAAPPETDLRMLRLDGAFPGFSPNKHRVAFISKSFSRVDVMRIDGTERSTIFRGTHRSIFGMSWSPAAPETIAFSHGTVFGQASAEVNLRTANSDGSGLTNLTSGAGNNGFPCYSPDGKQLVFRSGRDGRKNLYIMDRNGENTHRLTEGDWTDTMCDWSPDGQWITFASDRDDNFEVWLVRPDGKDLRKVIGGGRNNHPHFSPDGDWIVFTSQRAGLSAEAVSLPRQPQPYGDLFAVRVDGSGLIRLTHNGFEEGTPAWAPVKASN